MSPVVLIRKSSSGRFIRFGGAVEYRGRSLKVAGSVHADVILKCAWGGGGIVKGPGKKPRRQWRAEKKTTHPTNFRYIQTACGHVIGRHFTSTNESSREKNLPRNPWAPRLYPEGCNSSIIRIPSNIDWRAGVQFK